ncbi:hypothetical protein ADL12_01910 [Streptomyces regalis]|uniref:Uncharacterized protein n=1 Tax=Streptomyces regalis TaxID=68262 RepID=A0A0X3VPU7_9ACTN|nr:hypothetical protein ADL12_01910 [Streptomyces regalis]
MVSIRDLPGGWGGGSEWIEQGEGGAKCPGGLREWIQRKWVLPKGTEDLRRHGWSLRALGWWSA